MGCPCCFGRTSSVGLHDQRRSGWMALPLLGLGCVTTVMALLSSGEPTKTSDCGNEMLLTWNPDCDCAEALRRTCGH